MQLKDEIEQSADTLEKLFYRATQARDEAPKGPEKTRLRRITKKIDEALSLLENAEDEVSGNNINASAHESLSGGLQPAT